jgi:uncharacterized protein
LNQAFNSATKAAFDWKAFDRAYVIDNEDAALDLIKTGFNYDIHMNKVCASGVSPLLWVLKWAATDRIAMKMLDCGASYRFADNDGCSPPQQAAINGRTEALRHMLKHGVDVNTVDKEGQTLLGLAAKHNHAETVQMLLENGADAQKTDMHGMTPLARAAVLGKIDAARCLVAWHVNPDASDNGGWTPLMWAMLVDDHPVMEELMNAGANPFLRDSDSTDLLTNETSRPAAIESRKLQAAGENAWAMSQTVVKTPFHVSKPLSLRRSLTATAP